MSVYTSGEGEEEKETASKLFKLRERKKKKHVEGNGVIPQGGMSLKSPSGSALKPQTLPLSCQMNTSSQSG